MKICRNQATDEPRSECWSALRGTDRVSHDGTAAPEGLRCTDGGISRGLVLDLGIHLGAEQNDNVQQPEPNHKANDGT